MKNKGFTLIELLVTASIIAVLMAVGIVIYLNGRQKAQDARRIEDLRNIQKAMEQYYTSEGQYPATCYSGGDSLQTSGGTSLINDFPTQPDDTDYDSSACSSSGYCYCAEMDVSDGNSGADCTWSGSGYYCVDARQ